MSGQNLLGLALGCVWAFFLSAGPPGFLSQHFSGPFDVVHSPPPPFLSELLLFWCFVFLAVRFPIDFLMVAWWTCVFSIFCRFASFFFPPHLAPWWVSIGPRLSPSLAGKWIDCIGGGDCFQTQKCLPTKSSMGKRKTLLEENLAFGVVGAAGMQCASAAV